MRRSRVGSRLLWVSLGAILAAGAVLLIVLSLPGQLNAFRTPSQIVAAELPPGKVFRLGGQIVPGSYSTSDGIEHRFTLADSDGGSMALRYSGALPDLFREGQGVVTQGTLGSDGIFVASEVLAKHDENYMPPELEASLKDKAGMSCMPVART